MPRSSLQLSSAMAYLPFRSSLVFRGASSTQSINSCSMWFMVYPIVSRFRIYLYVQVAGMWVWTSPKRVVFIAGCSFLMFHFAPVLFIGVRESDFHGIYVFLRNGPTFFMRIMYLRLVQIVIFCIGVAYLFSASCFVFSCSLRGTLSIFSLGWGCFSQLIHFWWWY